MSEERTKDSAGTREAAPSEPRISEQKTSEQKTSEKKASEQKTSEQKTSEPEASGPGPSDPHARMVEALAQGARAATEAMQRMMEAAAKAAVLGADALASSASAGGASAAQAATDPQQAMAGFVAGWGQALEQLASLQAGFLKGLLEDLPETGRQRLGAACFSQLERLAKTNWEEELRRFSELPSAMTEQVGRGDPERLAGLFATMTKEYLADLESLKASAGPTDLSRITAALARVAGGAPDAEAQRVMERLTEAMSVKARYGTEYYADPDKTPVGQTPRELVHQQGKISLYHYLPGPGAPPRRGDPVLLVYSVINKPYILDLLPGYSFVEHLLAEGLDVYLVDWGPTEPGDRTTTLDSYIDPGITGCMAAIRERTGAQRVSLFGHCIGGNLALMAAALRPEEVGRIVTLTTPMTAAEGGVVSVWTDRDVLPIDAILDTYGHMPAKLIRYTFIALKPYYEVMKWKMFLEKLGDDQVMGLFYPVDRWANENVDIPGLVFKKFIEEVFHADRFRKGETRIGGQKVDLKAIRCPVMNLAATRDWIVPPESAIVLENMVGSEDYRYVSIEGAHVGIMIDPRSRPIWTEMSDFLLGK